MILLFDADSLIFAACCKQRDEYDDSPYYTDIQDAVAKYEEHFMKIINDISELYPVDEVYTFNGSRGNFRKMLTKKYKANRKSQPKPPLLDDMHEYVHTQWCGIKGYGVETDDMVARYWKNLSDEIGRDSVMIVSIDKDYRQFPCLLYNYHPNHKEVINISPEEAIYNFYAQMIIGDAADNVNYFRGKGKSFAQKYYSDCNTKYQYTRRLYELFQKEYKGKAREKYVECYNLLKLRTE